MKLEGKLMWLIAGLAFAGVLDYFGGQIANHNTALREEFLQEHLRVLRCVVTWHQKMTNEFPKDLGMAVRSQKYPDGILHNSLDRYGTPIRVTNVLDHLGGWYYNPQTGEVRANSPKVRIWILPPFGRMQDPAAF